MMRKRILSLILALALVLGTAPSALAAAQPTLFCGITVSTGEVELILEDLDGSAVYGAQIEMTFSGAYRDSDFEFLADSRTAYAAQSVQEAGQDRTKVTLYLTDRAPLNENTVLHMGVLRVADGAENALPDQAAITLLDADLRPMTGYMSGSIPTDIAVVKEDNPSWPGWPFFPPSKPDTPAEPDIPDTPEEPSVPVVPPLPVTPAALPFTDVKTGDWFYDAVAYVYGKGMMQGVSASSFAPGSTTSRAMIVTILHRLEGSPAASPASFSDVSASAYYAAPVAWASANGIVTGYTDGTFKPNAPITREQMAAILYRYASYKGLVGSATAVSSPNGFPDASSISPYAADAVRSVSPRFA